MYSYTGNNPVNYVDPTGHVAVALSNPVGFLILILLFGAAGACVYFAINPDDVIIGPSLDINLGTGAPNTPEDPNEEKKEVPDPNDNNNRWGRPETLDDHFNRHGGDFNAENPQDYARQANEFYNNRANYQVKVDENGITRVYDPNTNTFGSYNPDGTTRTFFKPDLNGIPDGQAYFNNQPGVLQN